MSIGRPRLTKILVASLFRFDNIISSLRPYWGLAVLCISSPKRHKVRNIIYLFVLMNFSKRLYHPYLQRQVVLIIGLNHIGFELEIILMYN
jgi:hypothetical protein